jgi:hypothetical protein
MTTPAVRVLIASPREARLIDRIRAVGPRLDTTRPRLLSASLDWAAHGEANSRRGLGRRVWRAQTVSDVG